MGIKDIDQSTYKPALAVLLNDTPVRSSLVTYVLHATEFSTQGNSFFVHYPERLAETLSDMACKDKATGLAKVKKEKEDYYRHLRKLNRTRSGPVC